MSSTRYSNDQWVELIPPAPPPAALDSWLVLTVSLVLLALTVMLIVHWRRPRSRALRRIKQLRASSRRQANTKPACHELRRCLQTAIGEHALQRAQTDDRDWQRFVQRLHRLCYQPQTPNAAQFEQIAGEARVWLKRLDT